MNPNPRVLTETPDVSIKAKDDVGRKLRNFLVMNDASDLSRMDVEIESHKLPDLYRALDYAFPAAQGYSMTVRGLGGLLGHDRNGRLAPLDNPALDALLTQPIEGDFGWTGTQRLAVGPERTHDFPRHAVYLLAQGAHRALLQPYRAPFGPPQLSAASRNTREEHEWLGDVLRLVTCWMDEHSCYRTRMLRPVATSANELAFRFLNVPDAADIQLPPHLVRELEQSFLNFQIHRSTLAAIGFEARRGILLHGEPGTGKTVTCRYLKARLPEHTFFVVDSRAFGLLNEVFRCARKLAPAVVVIEDVDMIAAERTVGSSNWILGDLLNLLDGIQDRDDVGIILTSNSAAFLERALVDRPGRVDHVITYDPPADAQRAHLVRSFTSELTVQIDDGTLVNLTAGLTPAQIRELVKRACILALERAGPKWTRVLTLADIEEGLASLRTSQSTRRARRIRLPAA